MSLLCALGYVEAESCKLEGCDRLGLCSWLWSVLQPSSLDVRVPEGNPKALRRYVC